MTECQVKLTKGMGLVKEAWAVLYCVVLISMLLGQAVCKMSVACIGTFLDSSGPQV